MELSLRLVKPGGCIAFIIPDSLFSQERQALRELLLEQTEICFIGRLGEKLFENVNRACAVIVCRRAISNGRNTVDCLRLTPAARKRILSGVATFSEVEEKLAHVVPQSRFAGNPDHVFDIDVAVEEQDALRCFRRLPWAFRDYLTSSRGVELSKSGRVCVCRACGKWMPLPAAPRPRCHHCKRLLRNSDTRVAVIVRDDGAPGCVPLIVGESVARYVLSQSLWIDTQYRGINYKPPSTYSPPKLLVRKTGVGISAAIDYTNGFTNQVVYIFRRRNEDNQPPPLEFLLGMVNSRAMYYYLVKNHGETEWRSHPYVTQKQILSLPLPGPDVLHKNHAKCVQEIADLLRPFALEGREPSVEVDARVEFLVATLYGLTRVHYETIYSTLDSVQDLLPIRTLKRVGIDDIFLA